MYAIQAKGVSKIYRLYRKPLDRLKEALLRKPLHQTFESLRNVSFVVPFGETIGIIGDNGAGKSTLLKILAGTLTPSSGEVVVHGRVAALLELGAGFHAEFTGLQNIYLNASLQGLTELEIKEREPFIIDFAELGQFIDRPLRTYSSGMVVRLAFSIATSVDPDILIIDEALSVGDQYFQKKCIDRMIEFRERGKTIVFCTHAMYMINQLCRRAIWLENGLIREQGLGTGTTAAYENYLRERTALQSKPEDAGPDKADRKTPVVVRSITLNGRTGPITLGYRDDLNVILEFESLDDRPFWVAMGIRRNDDMVCHAVSMARDNSRPLRRKGVGKVLLRYRSLPLLHGEFSIVGSIVDDSGLHCYHRTESSPFCIIPPDEWRNEIGLLDLDHEWQIL